MKIDIVYTTKSKYIKCVADEMARRDKTVGQGLITNRSVIVHLIIILSFAHTI